MAPKDHMFTIEREVKELRELSDIHDSDIKEIHELINSLKAQLSAQPTSTVSTNDIMILRSRVIYPLNLTVLQMEYIESQMSSFKKQIVEIKKVSDEPREGAGLEGTDDGWLKEIDTDL